MVAPLLFGSGEVSLLDPVVHVQAAATVVGDLSSKQDRDKVVASKSLPVDKTRNYGTLTTAVSRGGGGGDADDEEKAMLVETAPSEFVKTAMVDPESLKPHRPGQDPCLWLFHMLEGIAVTAALCLLVSQILPFLLVQQRSDITKKIGINSMALRLYISVFCVLFMGTEMGTPLSIVRNSQLLQTYASRGFLYSFLGLVCVEESYSERVRDIVAHVGDSFHIGWASVFMEVSSWLMLSTGMVYILLGVCCCKRLRDRKKQREVDAWKKYKEDMTAWKQRFE